MAFVALEPPIAQLCSCDARGPRPGPPATPPAIYPYGGSLFEAAKDGALNALEILITQHNADK